MRNDAKRLNVENAAVGVLVKEQKIELIAPSISEENATVLKNKYGEALSINIRETSQPARTEGTIPSNVEEYQKFFLVFFIVGGVLVIILTLFFLRRISPRKS